jgi:hypothetical protein
VCDYERITHNFIIENLKTHDYLIAGCKCIRNYEVILSEWGYRPEYIVYPSYFLRYTSWTTDGWEGEGGDPSAIQVHDRFLDRAAVDSRSVVEVKVPGATLREYVPVKRIPAIIEDEAKVKAPIPCPRCAKQGKDYCGKCNARGLILTRYNLARLCPSCQAVVLCEKCDDLEDKAHFRPRKIGYAADTKLLLSKEALEGKVPLHSFSELAAFLSLKVESNPKQSRSPPDDLPC